MTVQVGGFQNRGVCLQAFPSFLPHPLPALLLAPFFARSLTLVPRSLLLNRTETLATQATFSRFSHWHERALLEFRSLHNDPCYGRRALRDETERLCANEWIKSLFYLECQMISESLNLHFSCHKIVLKIQFNCSWLCLLSFLGGWVTLQFSQVPERYFGHLACQMGFRVHSMRQV